MDVVLFIASIAHAPPVAPTTREVLTSWTVDPLVVAGLVLLASTYILGTLQVWSLRGRWRLIRHRDAACFLGGLLALVAALVSPVDGLAEVLLSMHMVQHVLLAFVAAPLLVFSRADAAIAANISPAWFASLRPAFRSVRCAGSAPGAAWLVMAVVFWAWHAPWLYEFALHHEAVHAAEHLSMLAVGLVFWNAVVARAGSRSLHCGMAIALVFTTMLQMSVLTALMVFASEPWYGAYVESAPAWGLSAIVDQQLAALIMWGASNAALLAAVAILFVRWFGIEEARNHRDERSPHEPGLQPASHRR